jgi:hypothetical protein
MDDYGIKGGDGSYWQFWPVYLLWNAVTQTLTT